MDEVQDNGSVLLTNLNKVLKFSLDYAVDSGQEQAAINSALQRSLRDLDNKGSQKREVPDSVYNNIDDTVLGLSNEFAPIAFSNGDTLVYIGPPPPSKGEDPADYGYVSRHFSQLHKVRSSSLKALGSTKLDNLLGPKSIRTERRLRKDGVLGHFDISNIKYYLDLRPPNEDDEAIILLTDLTCTRGVLSWHKAQAVFDIPRTWIGGKDDFRRFSDAYTIQKPSSNENFKAKSYIAEGTDGARVAKQCPENGSGSRKNALEEPEEEEGKKENQLEPEYSAIRHRSAIERLLQAIEYGDPKLDSAPKLWTYFAIAKYFDVATHERINGWITRWIFAGRNADFIQCNPEVVLRIGMGITSSDLMKDAFSMLVGEKALLDVYGEEDPSVLAPLVRSVHGRRLELLDEDERNRIDHAAASLVRRVRSIFCNLVEKQMLWLERSKEYAKLIKIVTKNVNEELVVQEIIQLVQDYVRGRIYWVLCRDYHGIFPMLKYNLESVGTFYPGLPPRFNITYNTLNQPMRLFTRTFWIALHKENLDFGHCNTCNDGAGIRDVGGWNRLSHDMEERYEGNPEKGIKSIGRNALNEGAGKFNAIIGKHHEQAERARQDAIDASNKAWSTPNGSHSNSLISYAVPEVTAGPQGHAKRPSSGSIDSKSYANLDEMEHGLSDSNPNGSQKDDPSFSSASEKRRRLTSSDGSESLTVIQWAQGLELPMRSKKPDDDQDEIFVEAQENMARSQLSDATYKNYLSMVAERFAIGILETGRKSLTSLQIKELDKGQESQMPVEPQEDVAPEPAVLGALQSQGREQSATLQKQLQPIPPPVATDRAHDRQESPNGTKYGYVRDSISVLPEKYLLAHSSAVQTSVNLSGRIPGYVVEKLPDRARRDENNFGGYAGVQPHEQVHGVETCLSPLARTASENLTKQTSQGTMFSAATAAKDIMLGSYFPKKMGVASPTQRKKSALTPSPTNQVVHLPPKRLGPNEGYLDVTMMLEELTTELHKICGEVIFPPHLFHAAEQIPTDLIDTLMCLDDDEWKYLPLWAGGNDDGTGGVFDEADVPNLEKGGFLGGKRGIWNVGGTPVPSISDSNSSYDDIASSAVSTVGRASKNATDGTETIKSLSDTMSEEETGFTRQNELWDQIREMRVDDNIAVGFARADDAIVDDEDVVTVMGAGSDDVQGQMFGDIDDDENEIEHGQEGGEAQGEDPEMIGGDFDIINEYD